MTAQDGALVLLKVGNGADPIETFSVLGGLNLTRIAINTLIIEANQRESGTWRKLLSNAGIRSLSVSGSGRFDNSASEALVMNRSLSGLVSQFQISFGNGDVVEGPFLIQRYERSGQHDSAEEYSLSLESAGSIIFTSA